MSGTYGDSNDPGADFYTPGQLKRAPSATEAQRSALLWLRNRNGDGVFDRNGVLVAGGERAPYMRSTWNRLEALGLIERYLAGKRLRVTDKGSAIDVKGVSENAPCDFLSEAGDA